MWYSLGRGPRKAHGAHASDRLAQANDRDIVMRYEEALFLTHSHHFFSIHDTHIQLTDYALFSATI